MKSGEGDEIFGVLCILLAIACCFDYKTHRIPNWLIVCCMFAGLGYRLISGGYKGVLEYLASALLTTILLYFVFWIGAIGAGDVKMLGVCAGFFPWNKVLYFLFFALMIATVIALFKMYLGRNMKDRLYYLTYSCVEDGNFILPENGKVPEQGFAWRDRCSAVH